MFCGCTGNETSTSDQVDGTTVVMVIGVAGGVVLCVLMVTAMIIGGYTIIRLRGSAEATGPSQTSKIISSLNILSSN